MAKSLKHMRVTYCAGNLVPLRETPSETRRNPCGKRGKPCGKHIPLIKPLGRGRGNYGIPLPLLWLDQTSAEPLANRSPITSGSAARVPARALYLERVNP